MREVSLEEQDKRLTGFREEKDVVERRMQELDKSTGEVDASVDKLNKEQKKMQTDLELWRVWIIIIFL